MPIVSQAEPPAATNRSAGSYRRRQLRSLTKAGLRRAMREGMAKA